MWLTATDEGLNNSGTAGGALVRESGAKTPAGWCSNRVQVGLRWRFLHAKNPTQKKRSTTEVDRF